MSRVPSQFFRTIVPLPLVATFVSLLGIASPGVAVAQDCPNAAIRAQQGPVVEALPDCMALEMVSPAEKYSQDAYPESVSADGSRATYMTLGDAVNDPPLQLALLGDLYVASRSGSGWVGETTLPSPAKAGTIVMTWGQFLPRSLSPDFSRWVAWGATEAQFNLDSASVWRSGVGDVFAPLSPLLASSASNGGDYVARAEFLGASADHGRVVIEAGGLESTLIPGDPVPSGSGADPSAYVVGLDGGGAPSVWLLARDGSGTVWGGRCGVRMPRNQGAVSVDGSRIYFTTRPSQTGSGECDAVANPLRIMRRVETSGGPEISELFESECDRVAPACDTTDGDDVYQGASVDGTKVFFTTTRQLADSDLDAGFPGLPCGTFFGSPGCDLYMYDSERPAGERLVQVSAGDTEAVQVSSTGSRRPRPTARMPTSSPRGS